MKPEAWLGLISTVFIAAGFAIDHWDSLSVFFREYVVRRLLVDIWFIWVGVFAYGLYMFVRFQIKLNRQAKTFEGRNRAYREASTIK